MIENFFDLLSDLVSGLFAVASEPRDGRPRQPLDDGGTWAREAASQVAAAVGGEVREEGLTMVVVVDDGEVRGRVTVWAEVGDEQHLQYLAVFRTPKQASPWWSAPTRERVAVATAQGGVFDGGALTMTPIPGTFPGSVEVARLARVGLDAAVAVATDPEDRVALATDDPEVEVRVRALRSLADEGALPPGLAERLSAAREPAVAVAAAAAWAGGEPVLWRHAAGPEAGAALDALARRGVPRPRWEAALVAALEAWPSREVVAAAQAHAGPGVLAALRGAPPPLRLLAERAAAAIRARSHGAVGGLAVAEPAGGGLSVPAPDSRGALSTKEGT